MSPAGFWFFLGVVVATIWAGWQIRRRCRLYGPWWFGSALQASAAMPPAAGRVSEQLPSWALRSPGLVAMVGCLLVGLTTMVGLHVAGVDQAGTGAALMAEVTGMSVLCGLWLRGRDRLVPTGGQVGASVGEWGRRGGQGGRNDLVRPLADQPRGGMTTKTQRVVAPPQEDARVIERFDPAPDGQEGVIWAGYYVVYPPISDTDELLDFLARLLRERGALPPLSDAEEWWQRLDEGPLTDEWDRPRQ